MKIDDPEIQAYIQGKLSPEEEASLLEKLKNYPEVLDLAETLRRTQKLIDSDKANNEVPEIARREVKVDPSADSPAPQLAFSAEQIFKPLFGDSWRFGLTMILAAIGILLFIFVLVPFVEMFAKDIVGENIKSEFGKEVSSGQGQSLGRHGLIHEAANFEVDASAKAFTEDIMNSFESLPKKKAEYYSELTRVLTSHPAQPGEYSVPLQKQVEQGLKNIEAIKKGASINPKSVSPDEIVGALAPSLTESVGPIHLEADWSKTPWDPSRSLLSLRLSVSSSVPDENSAGVSRALVFSQLSEALADRFQAESQNIRPSFLSFERAFKELASNSKAGDILEAVVFLGGPIQQLDYNRIKRWLSKPRTRLVVVDFTGKQKASFSPLHFTVDKFLYISAPTPYLAKKAFFNYSDGEGLSLHNVKLMFQPKFGAYKVIDRLGGEPKSFSLKTQNYRFANWLAYGDQAIGVFLVDTNLEEAPLDETVAEVELAFQETFGRERLSRMQVSLTAQELKAEPGLAHKQIVASTWLALMLSGELSLDKPKFAELKEFAQEIQDPKFQDLLEDIENYYIE